MTLNENNNIGFKIFMAFVIIGGAILLDLAIFGGISDAGFDLEGFIQKIFFDNIDHTDCDVSFYYNDPSHERFINVVDIEDGKQFINDMLDNIEEYDIADYVMGSTGEYDYLINSCGTELRFSKDNDLAEYEGELLTITAYKEELDEIVKKAMELKVPPRLYEDLYKPENLLDKSNVYPTTFTEFEEKRLELYWNSLSKAYVAVDLELIGNYALVIGNDIVYFDDLDGLVSYNGYIIELSDEILSILERYI